MWGENMDKHEEERLLKAMECHARSPHLNNCSNCPYQDSEEEDEDGNYEGECTWLIANRALELLKAQREKIEHAKMWLMASGVDLDAMCDEQEAKT